MCAILNGNPFITIISCYSPTNSSDEMDITTFWYKLYSLAEHIPKHNVLIIGGDMNAQIGKDKNNKFCLHNLAKRNSEYLIDFSFENSLSCLNIKFQKWKGKWRTYSNSNNTKARLDYILINKTKINRTMNCEVYSSFEGVL